MKENENNQTSLTQEDLLQPGHVVKGMILFEAQSIMQPDMMIFVQNGGES